ncbi:Uncharacterised protein [Klebsiella grimontii]|uniref:Uncharacterized protein n=1 Tax=Klebsiella grimontii TaxID=2058152 RepID=A0A7H4PAD6_9ENTR|nr:Uncharacterised protein [Klebsiella grimontii]
MIAQHDANAIAKLFHETQHFQRTGAARDQVAREPQRINLRVKLHLL